MPYLIGCSRCDAVGEASFPVNQLQPVFPQDWLTLTLFVSPGDDAEGHYEKLDLCPNCKLELREWVGKKVTRTKKK